MSQDLQKSASKAATAAALTIMVVGTALGMYFQPSTATVYPWWSQLAGAAGSAAYLLFLSREDGSRLRAFVLHYFYAFAAVLLAVRLADVAVQYGAERLLAVLPVAAMFIAVLMTHVVGGKPDLVISSKRLSD